MNEPESRFNRGIIVSLDIAYITCIIKSVPLRKEPDIFILLQPVISEAFYILYKIVFFSVRDIVMLKKALYISGLAVADDVIMIPQFLQLLPCIRYSVI